MRPTLSFYKVLFYVLATLELLSTLNVRVVQPKKIEVGFEQGPIHLNYEYQLKSKTSPLLFQ